LKRRVPGFLVLQPSARCIIGNAGNVDLALRDGRSRVPTAAKVRASSRSASAARRVDGLGYRKDRTDVAFAKGCNELLEAWEGLSSADLAFRDKYELVFCGWSAAMMFLSRICPRYARVGMLVMLGRNSARSRANLRCLGLLHSAVQK
jgi:hypothetical protein